jgi:serine/threonine protein kinase
VHDVYTFVLQFLCRLFSIFLLYSFSGKSACDEPKPCLESDLFSLGCCLYMLACGLYPFDDKRSTYLRKEMRPQECQVRLDQNIQR